MLDALGQAIVAIAKRAYRDAALLIRREDYRHRRGVIELGRISPGGCRRRDRAKLLKQREPVEH
jgi:hypothetical protein